jgi:circadian clock protein KaiC
VRSNRTACAGCSELGGCTTFLLTSGTKDHLGPERTMVDGLVELSDPLFGSQRERRLEVPKFRGGRCLRGQHSFEITDRGLVVHPRTEAMLCRPTGATLASDARVTTGCRGLDQILRGGYPIGSTTMALGPSGAGKTSLGLHFMSACTPQDPGVYLSFYETEDRAALKARRLGLPLTELLKSNVVRFAWLPTTESILDSSAGQLLELVRKQKASRIFIDGLDGFQQLATDSSRLVRVFTALANEFRSHGATTLYTAESHTIVANQLESPPTGVSTMVENLVLLRYAEVDSSLRRLISVLKVRDSDFDALVREIEFTEAGLLVKGPFTGWENLVGGSARRHGRQHDDDLK